MATANISGIGQGAVSTAPISWPLAALSGALALATAALIGWVTGLWGVALVFAGVLGAGLAVMIARTASARAPAQMISAPDGAVAVLLDAIPRAAVLTDSDGAIICANTAYGAMAPGYPSPTGLAHDPADQQTLDALATAALTGSPGRATIAVGATHQDVLCVRSAPGRLLWQFTSTAADAVLAPVTDMLAGPLGQVLAQSRISLFVADGAGKILGCSLTPDGKPGADVQGSNLRDWLAYTQGNLAWAGGVAVDAQEVALNASDGAEAGHLIALRPSGASDDAGLASLDKVLPPFVDQLPLALALTDRDGRLLYFNTAFAGMTGFAGQTSAPTQYPSDLVVDADRIALSDLVRRVGSGVSHKQVAAVHLRAQTGEPVQLTVAPIGGGSPRAGGPATLITLSDNAERRKLEQQVAQAQKMQGIGQLAGGIAHDFNNILTAISGFCELLLQRHPPGDPSFSDINQVLSNSNRAAALVKQLLAFSRQQTLSPVTVQITDLLTEQLVTLKRLIGEGVQLNVQHGRDLGSVRVDPTQFYQVVMNLIVNARDAMPDGGRISIRTFNAVPGALPRAHADLLQTEPYVALEIADTGGGIPADVLPKIFEPFFTTKEVGKGTGLGLSTAYGIVKQSNGFIFAESAKGRGTTFSVYLPTTQAVPATDLTASKRLEAVDDLWGSGTILLVEDEDAVRAFAAKALERKGYTVLTAPSGEEALELLTAHCADVDLIVSDVVMPNMDGPTMARAARKMRPDVPLIFVSGYAEETLRQSLSDVMDTQRVTFLPKPFSLKELARAVKTVLEGTRSGRE